MALVIAVCSMKGGVGKTTLAVQLGAALAELSAARVLLCDLDGQGGLANYFGLTVGEATMRELLLGKVSLPEARVAVRPNVHLIPADERLYGLEAEIGLRAHREYRLAEVLADSRERYAYVVLDTPPVVSWALLNGLHAADGLLLPIELEDLPLRSLSTYTALLAETIAQGQFRARVAGIVPNKYEPRTKHRRLALEELREAFPGLVFPPIRDSVKVPDAGKRAQTIYEYAPTSQVAEDYVTVAKEVLRWRYANQRSKGPSTGPKPTVASSPS